MDKKLTITFAETTPGEVDIQLESSDPADDVNDIIALLHSTLQALSTGIPDEEIWDKD